MKLNLKWLILILLSFAMLSTFFGSVVSSIIVSNNTLKDNYLAENRYYAEKLADTTDLLFIDMFKSLKVEALTKDYQPAEIPQIRSNLKNLLNSTSYFNTTAFVNSQGKLIAAYPNYHLENTILTSIGAREALEKRKATISQPYVGVIGELLILISVPVYDGNGEYIGFLAGTIQLHAKNNSLKNVLGQHPQHENNSYVYVVDASGNIIYHPDSSRINENVKHNIFVQQLMAGKTGSMEGHNTKNEIMLAGFARTRSVSHWGIVSQTPKAAAMEPTIELVKRTIYSTIPFMLFFFLLSVYLLTKIIHPIRDLALYARDVTKNKQQSPDTIPDWYFEIRELKRAILIAMEYYQTKLHSAEKETSHDQLTGLYNRRALEKIISKIDSYSIILFDIDHFKKVNDVYGHQVGDEVLKYVAEIIQDQTSEEEHCFRWGGEEFMIILPETDLEEAALKAENIREKFEHTKSPTGKPITASIGVGNLPQTANHYNELLNLTDQALYHAKQAGRNRVHLADKK